MPSNTVPVVDSDYTASTYIHTFIAHQLSIPFPRADELEAGQLVVILSHCQLQ